MTTTNIQLAFNLYAVALLGFAGVIWNTDDILNLFIKLFFLGIAVMFVISAGMGYFSVVLSVLAIIGFLLVVIFIHGTYRNLYKFAYFLGIAMAIFTMIRS